MIAPATAAAITAHSGTVPREAATPPKMTAISPGNTKPTNAEASSAGKANTSARTSQPGSDRMRSVTLTTRPAVATAAHPGRDIRSRRAAGVAGEVVMAIRSPYLCGRFRSTPCGAPFRPIAANPARLSRWSQDWPKATPQGRGLDAGGGRRTLGERPGGVVWFRSWLLRHDGSGIGVCGYGGRPALSRSARQVWSRRHDDRWGGPAGGVAAPGFRGCPSRGWQQE